MHVRVVNKKSFGIFASSENNEDDYVNIQNVIMKIDYKINNNITNKAYIVNGVILHDILMW